MKGVGEKWGVCLSLVLVLVLVVVGVVVVVVVFCLSLSLSISFFLALSLSLSLARALLACCNTCVVPVLVHVGSWCRTVFVPIRHTCRALKTLAPVRTASPTSSQSSITATPSLLCGWDSRDRSVFAQHHKAQQHCKSRHTKVFVLLPHKKGKRRQEKKNQREKSTCTFSSFLPSFLPSFSSKVRLCPARTWGLGDGILVGGSFIVVCVAFLCT